MSWLRKLRSHSFVTAIGNRLSIPNYYLVAATGWVSRAAQVLAKVIAIPIVLNYLGVDVYGAFVVVVALFGWFQLADFGVGDSLQNFISEARVRNGNLQLLLDNAVVLIIGASIVILAVFTIFAYPLQYLLFHHIAPQIISRQWYLLFVIGDIYVFTVAFNISFRVFFAKHQAYWAYLYQALGPIFSVIAVIVVRYMYSGDDKLFFSLLAWTLPPLFWGFVSYMHCFPRIRILNNLDFSLIRKMIHRGVRFWGYAFGTALILMMDYIVMSQTLTSKDITVYYILAKGFDMIFFVYQAVLTVIWPQLTEAFAKKQWKKANGLLLRNVWVGTIFVLLCTICVFLGKGIISHVLAPNKNIVLPFITIILFGLYYLQRVWAETYAVGLKSQNCLRVFWAYLPVQAILCITGMYFLSLYLGVNGILLGLMISFALTANWLLPLVYSRQKQRIGINQDE